MKKYVREKLRASPHAFGLIGRWREHPDFDRRVVRRGDDLVIEGFPRSGNTFATMAFRLAQSRPLKIGNHFHAPAQILRARRFGIPAMVVVRTPMDAALSFLVYYQGKLSADRALEQYISFYQPLLRYPDAYTIAPFDEVVSDFSTSIARLNNKFGTCFEGYDHNLLDDAARAAIGKKRKKRLMINNKDQNDVSSLTVPSNEKSQLKQLYADSFSLPHIQAKLSEATELFTNLMPTAQEHQDK